MNREELIDSLRERVAELEGELAGIKGQEPAKYEFQAEDGSWHPFLSERHYQNTITDGWPIRSLYTSPPTKQSVVVPDREECDDDRKHPNSWTDYAIGWNACRRETKRLNGQSK